MKNKISLAVISLLVSLQPLAISQDASADAEKKESKPKVKLASLRIEGALEEGVEQDLGLSFLSFSKEASLLPSLLRKIEKAKKDDEVKGLILKIQGPQVGMAKLSAIRNALQDFKSAEKKIHVYFDQAESKEYLIATVADDISIAPAGWLMIPGLRIEMTYMKDLLDWLGVKADVVHIGNFKTAYENFYRNDMSDGQRTAYGAILDGFYEQMLSYLAEGRKMDRERAKAAIDTAIFPAAQARARGLVDFVEYEDEFMARLKTTYGENFSVIDNYGKKKKKDFDFNSFTAIFEIMGELAKKPEVPKGDKVAVVYAVGPINSGKSSDSMFGGKTMGSETISKAIRKAAEDDTVKAIVMRIDSPGGSGLASDEIWREVVRAKAKKPFIASMSDVAGSGGYYIAMAADSIVAEPNTITGSIGVIGMKLVLGGMYEKIGMHTQYLQRGKNAGMFSSASMFNPDERTLMTRLLENFYQDFVSKVADGRKRSFEVMEKVAQGRIWTGTTAKEIGLVDELGGLDYAIQIAKTRAGIDAKKAMPVLELPAPKNFMEMLEEGGLPFMQSQLMQNSQSIPGALLSLPEVQKAYRWLNQLVQLKDPALCLMPVEIEVK